MWENHVWQRKLFILVGRQVTHCTAKGGSSDYTSFMAIENSSSLQSNFFIPVFVRRIKKSFFVGKSRAPNSAFWATSPHTYMQMGGKSCGQIWSGKVMIFSSFPFCFSSSLTFGVLELRGRDFFSRSAMLLAKDVQRLRRQYRGGGGGSLIQEKQHSNTMGFK